MKWIKRLFGYKEKEPVELKEPVDPKNCKHRLKFSYRGKSYYGGVTFPIYKCEKCGYEQVGTEHLEGEQYED